jgi:glycosyltransferase
MMNSIHNQTRTDIEHIIIDGDSTDGTVELLRKYQKKGWINHLVSEKDKGIYSAINKGIRISTGKFLQIMNTDDYFLDLDYFRKCVKILQNNKIAFTHADRIIKSRENKPDYIKKGDEKVAFFRMPFRHQTMVVRRQIYDQMGLFDEKYKIASDYKFVLQMLIARKRGHYFSKTVLCSLDGGMSSNRKKCIQEISKILFEVYGKKNNLTLDDCRAIYLRKIDSKLHSKILTNVKDKKILNSLEKCYQQDFKNE